MPRKQKAEVDPVKAADNTAAPAPAKKPATPKAKSAAATHKAPAKRAARNTTKKCPETEVVEVVELVDEVPESVVVESVEVIEAVYTAPTVELVAVEKADFQEYFEPGTPEEREEIARIAYSYYAARNFAFGDPLADWVRAEEEYRSRRLARV
jgi:hypothetical protein